MDIQLSESLEFPAKGSSSATSSSPQDRRPCFLCGSWKGDQLFVESWPIVGVGTLTLGVRVCSGCGLVYQDPVIPWGTMGRYYSALSNYTNPGRDGLPSKRKVETVDGQLELLQQHVSQPGRAFQVGCSDGYTLHRLREAGWSAMGVDPSPSAIELAAARWDLNLEVGLFEAWEPQHEATYDLFVLTHVLEHIYDPVAALEKCGRMLRPGGLALIETPVVEAPDRWPPGYFTFEHVNFFSVATMTRTLERAGFQLVSPLQVRLDHDEYPILRGVARFVNQCKSSTALLPEVGSSLELCRDYLELEQREWERIDGLLRRELAGVQRAIVWGAGIHSSQLLTKTSLTSCADIEFFVDCDIQKIGLFLGAYPVKGPDAVDFSDPSQGIVISSRDSEEEIRASILSHAPAAKVIPLYAS